MHWLKELAHSLSSIFRRSYKEQELSEELQFHLERQIEQNLAAGMPPEEARHAALRLFGGVQQVKEECRDMRRVNYVENFLQDVRYGVRQLRRSPGFAVVAVLTLALGVGANTALFSVVNGVLLNPLPFPDPNQLVALHESKPFFEQGAIPYPQFLDWQKQNRTFSAMAVYRSTGLSLTGLGEAERLNAEFVTSDFFPLLGVKPVIGRTFASGEDRIGAAPLVMVSEGLWRRKLGASPDALGKTLTLDGRGYTLVGVIPSSFHLFVSFRSRDAYVPIGQWDNPLLLHRNAALGIHGIGRLKSGVMLEHARADMAAVTANLARAYPDTDRGNGTTIVPLKEQMVGHVRPLLLVLLGAVGFVLLIACVNVANLLLARSTGRAREFAIRAALGAGRARVIRQLLAESVLLAMAGGALGLLLASWGTRAALGMLPSGLPRTEEIHLDTRVLIFTAAMSLLAGTLFGLVPSIKGSRPDFHETLQEGGRGVSGVRHGAQGIFVAAETAMALVLLAGAGLLLRSLARIWSVDPGFDPRHVLTFSYAFPPAMGAASPDAIRAACRDLGGKIESIPGVEAVSLSWGGLPIASEDDEHFWLDGQPKPQSENEMSWALSYVIEPGYLKAMGIPLERGRFFTAQDNEHRRTVVVVDDVFARKFFPGQNPIGRRIHLNNFDQVAEIVGVIGHVKQWGLDSDDANPLRAELYHPFMQLPDKAMALSATGIDVVVRSSEAPGPLLASVRRVTGELSRERVLYGAQTMEEIISDSLAARRFALEIFGAFAALALLLAAVGVYGVVSYLAGERTHEIGIRVALGAERRDILRLVVGHGARMALAGVGAGLIAALGLARLLARYSLLFGVSAADPVTFGAVALLLTLVALAACYVPAHRAAKVDPTVALRYE